MRLRVLAAGAVLGAAAAGAAVAQVPIVQPQRQMNLGATVETFYDTNIARSSSVLAARRGVSRDDAVLRPSLTANIVQPLGSQALFLIGSVGKDFHRENPQLDHARADVTGGYTSRFGPCKPTLATAYKAAQSDLQDSDDQTVSNLQKTTSVVGGIECGRNIGPGFNAMYLRADTKNSAALRVPSDYSVKSSNLGLTYTNPTLGKAAFVYSYADTQFPNRVIPGRPIGDGFWTQSFGLSYQRDFGSRITFDVLGSRTLVKREFAPPGTKLKFTSNTYGANVAYRLGTRIELEGHALREVRPSSRPGKLYDIATSGEVLANYKLGSRYKITLGHRIEDVNSNSDTAALGRPVVTQSRLNTTYGTVRYRQSDRLSLAFSVDREDRRANLSDFNYKSTHFGLTATVGF